MTWADAIGFGALGISLTGQFFVARKNPLGWKLRFGAGFLWFAFALAIHRWPLIATSITYLSIDLYGLLNSRRK